MSRNGNVERDAPIDFPTGAAAPFRPDRADDPDMCSNGAAAVRTVGKGERTNLRFAARGKGIFACTVELQHRDIGAGIASYKRRRNRRALKHHFVRLGLRQRLLRRDDDAGAPNRPAAIVRAFRPDLCDQRPRGLRPRAQRLREGFQSVA